MSDTVKTAERHFAVFYSPGTFFSEASERQIESWSVPEAFRIAQTITERYGARPFAFVLETRLVTVPDGDLPSVALKTLKRSGRHFIDGRAMTLEDVQREMPEAEILISNMRINNIAGIVSGPVRSKGWRWTHDLRADDVLLDSDGIQVTP